MSLAASVNIATSSGLTTGCTAKIWGCRQKGSIAREITLRPPIERYCFGPPDPARSPRPAATMIAAVRLGIGIVIRWAQSGEETGRLPEGAALITLSGENRRIPASGAYFVALHLQDRQNCLKCRH